MLLSLAPELIQSISRELELMEDIKSFRLTSKQMDRALAAEVLWCITVDINQENFERELCKLEYFAAGSSSCRLVRRIVIRSLSPPSIDPWAPMVRTKRKKRAAQTEKLKKCLYTALSSLTTVRTVRWIPGVSDGEWAQDAVMDALKTLPNLQHLHVALLTCQIEIPFQFFTALRHINIHCVNEEARHSVHHQKTFENLVKMISQSPLLETIRLSNSPNYTQNVARSLHQLFECHPQSIPPLRLKHLSLVNYLVRLDDKTVMRHLRHLTSLSLEDLLEPHTLQLGNPNLSDLILQDNLEKQNRWGSSYEQIWRVICNTELKLEEITLDRTPSAFLEYINSYSGLKKLKIVTKGYNGQVESDSAAKRFYEGLEKHVGSIKELDIDACYEGLWCFGHHNQALFSTLQHLRTLSVRVRSDHFVPSSSKDIVDILIDTAVIYMPQLESLFACVAKLEINRYMKSRNGPRIHCARFKQKIAARVLEYQAPLGCNRLPMFKIGIWLPEEAFVGQSPDLLKKGERLRYLPDSVDVDVDGDRTRTRRC